MSVHSLITEGYSDNNYQLILEGFTTSTPWINQLFTKLEKKSVGYTLIDYRYIEAGLADHTILDDIMEKLKK